MPLWGTKSGLENMPNWLTDEQKESCYATAAGWVYKHPNGTEEVLVSVKGLDTRVGAPTITAVRFSGGAYTVGATKQVKVTYNEKVTVVGAPTLVVTDSATNDAVATYASSNANGTVLTFEFVVAAGSETLSIAAQSLVKGVGVDIKEAKAPGTLNAEIAISEAVALAAGTKAVTV